MQSPWQAIDGLQSLSQEPAMTTATALNGYNRTLIARTAGSRSTAGAPSFKMPNFAAMRAALPDMPARESTATIVAGVAGRLALAAVPFCALGWLFITR
jgi:hypothetical protein